MKRNELVDLVEKGTREIVESGRWQEYLDTAARFHRYSPCNCILILLQKPDATQMAGYNAWKKMGHYVMKGQHGISIWAPGYKKDKDDPEKGVTYFFPVTVFDVSQTDGDPLPTLGDELLGSDHQELVGRLVAASESKGWPVAFDYEGAANGLFYKDGRIALNRENSPDQNAKTLLHEMAHGIMGKNGNRDLDEFLAESAAYVAAKSLGLDSSSYSFGYILSWAGGPENASKTIKEQAEKVLHTANELLSLVTV